MVGQAMARTKPGGVREPWLGSHTGAEHPPIFLITVEALRSDLFFGQSEPTRMPRTLEWARECSAFSRAYADASFTDLALLSLMSGMHSRHARRGYGVSVIPGDAATGRPSRPPGKPKRTF